MFLTKKLLFRANGLFWIGKWHISLMAVPKKYYLGQMSHLGSKMVHPHNSGSAVRIVLQFHTMTGAKRDMEITLMIFLEKILFRAIWSFWPENGTST